MTVHKIVTDSSPSPLSSPPPEADTAPGEKRREEAGRIEGLPHKGKKVIEHFPQCVVV